MRVRACLDHATHESRYADDCDVSRFVGGEVVGPEGSVVGTVLDAWIEDGSLCAEVDMPDDLLAP